MSVNITLRLTEKMVERIDVVMHNSGDQLSRQEYIRQKLADGLEKDEAHIAIRNLGKGEEG